jgi:O-antigen/teichoic acid export membrane protein
MTPVALVSTPTIADAPSKPNSPSPEREMVGGTIRIFLGEALALPTGLIVTAILTRELGPTGYGGFTLAITAVTWIEWSIAAMFARASFKYVAEATDWRPVATTMIRMRLIMSVVAALGLAALAGPIAALLGAPELKGYLRLFAIDIPIFTAAQAHSNILVGIGAFRQRAWLSAGRWIARLVLVALLVELEFSIEGAIWASIGASIVELTIARYFVQPEIFRRSDFPARQLLQQALPLTLFAVSMRLFDKMDLFFLKALGASSADAGFYGGAQNLAIVPALVALSFSPLLLSTIARLMRDGADAQARQVARQALRWMVALAPFAAAAAAAGPEIVRLILGEAFLAAVTPFRLLIFAGLALGIVSTSTAILTAWGKAAWTFYLTAPIVPLAVAGHLALIPRFGPPGAALVTLSIATLAAIVTVVAVHRLSGASPPVGTLLRSAALSCIAYVITLSVPAAGAMLLVKLVVVCVAIGMGFLLLGERHSAGGLRFRHLASGGQPSL